MRTSPYSHHAPVLGLDTVAAEAPPGKPPRVSGDRPPGRFVFAAEAAGSIFPSLPFSCTVHSIFRSALNLKTSSDSQLISLISDQRHAHPRGAVVFGARFDSWSLNRGSPGYFDGYCLSFAAADAPRVLVASERAGAEECSPAIRISSGLVLALSRAEVLVAAARTERGSRAIFVGTELAATRGSGGTELGPTDIFEVRLRHAAADLTTAFASRSMAAAIRAAEGLVGLGTGLTPSGDDFLCGFLAARRAIAAGRAGDTRFLDGWGQSFIGIGDIGGAGTGAGNGDRAISRTNEISAAFLASAAVGRFSAALIDFARAIGSAAEGDDGAPALAAAVSALSQVGHGSGLDAAEGFLYGLQKGVEEHDGDEA